VKSSATVSIIIPTYNREKLLFRAIQSVLAQTYKNFELIIIDDASTDHTATVVSNFCEPRIRFIRLDQNNGVSIARNTGLSLCSGDYIAFLDSDDAWVPNKLEKQIKIFEKSAADTGVVYSSINILDGLKINQKGNTINATGHIYEDLLYQNFVGTPSSVILRKNCLNSDIRFDPLLRCCEDWDVWLKLAKDWKFVCISEPLITYLNHEDSQRGSTNSDAIISGYLRFLNRYHTPDFRKNVSRIGTFSLNRKAEYLMNIGRRLICHGSLVESNEAIQLSKQYFRLAYKTSPTSWKLLTHYLAALMGTSSYVRFQKLESEVRSFGSSALRRMNTFLGNP
jgi:glycosyltransferase involved in cell wall biosynthesis